MNIEELKSEYLAGSSASQLAKKYGVSVTTILTHLRRNQIQIRDKQAWREMEHKRIIAKIEAQPPPYDGKNLAPVLNLCSVAIIRHLVKAGYEWAGWRKGWIKLEVKP